MARQFRTRRSISGVTLVDVISILALFPILAVMSVPSFQNVTEAYMRRDGLREVERAAESAANRRQQTVYPSPDADNNLLTRD